MKILNQLSDSLKHKKVASPKEKLSFHKKDYFQLAGSWADDYYTTVAASRNRYKLFCFLLAGISGVVLLSTLSLVHTHEYTHSVSFLGVAEFASI